ncbi:3792_t:CDS:2 [Gigaspora rosea]|nr:3792_t:CDS:2 [Gigaspora rosea]
MLSFLKKELSNMKKIPVLLRTSSIIQDLNFFEIEHVQYFSTLAKVLESIPHKGFSNNNLGRKGIVLISDELCDPNFVEGLGLYDVVLKLIQILNSDSGLKSFGISSNGLDEEVVNEINEIANILYNTVLISLGLSFNQIGSEGAKTMALSLNISDLDLYSNEIE